MDSSVIIKEELIPPPQLILPQQEEYAPDTGGHEVEVEVDPLILISNQVPSINPTHFLMEEEAPPTTEVEVQVETNSIKIKPDNNSPCKPKPEIPPRRSFKASELGRTCLFCLKFAPKEIKEFQWRIPGAGCQTLAKQLQIFFIVHKLLDLPSSWSEIMLEKGDFPEVQYWLRVCGRCHPDIEMAWGLHQQLLQIQGKINGIKVKLKNKIVGSRGRWKLSSEDGGGNRIDLMNEIRESIDIDSSGNGFTPPLKNVPRTKKRKTPAWVPVKEIDFEIEDLTGNFDEPAPTAAAFVDDALYSPDNFHDDDEDPDWEEGEKRRSQRQRSRKTCSNLNSRPKAMKKDNPPLDTEVATDKPEAKPSKPARKRNRNHSYRYEISHSDLDGITEEEARREIERRLKQHQKVSHLKYYKPLPPTPKRTHVHIDINNIPDDPVAAKEVIDELRKRHRKVSHLKHYEPIPKRRSTSTANSIGKRARKYKPAYPLRCEVCPAKYEDGKEDKLKEHVQAHERCQYNDEFVCKQCKFPSESEAELELHTNRKHPRMMKKKCPHCDYTALKQSRINYHMERKHSDLPKPQPSLEELTCSICGKVAGDRSALSRHKRIEHPELFGKKLDPHAALQCDQCGEKFESAIRFEHHKNTHERKKIPDNYFCEMCGKGFKMKSRLKAHMANHDETGQWMCAHCGVDFRFKHILSRHIQTHHPETLDPSLVNPKFARKRDVDIVECKICHIKLPVALRRRHMRTHSDKAYKCDQCDRSYFKLQGLNKHKEINHSNGATNVNCPYCNKEFIHQEYLRWHFRNCRMKKAAEETQTQNDSKTDPQQQQQLQQYVPVISEAAGSVGVSFKISE